MNSTWKEALRQPVFVISFLLALACLAVLAWFVPSFFQNTILNKEGIVLDDFILNWLTPINWSLAILTLLYAALVISIASNAGKPWVILLGMATYCVVTWLRMGTIYFVTLEAPPGVIPLTDPFLNEVVYSKTDFVKDLFFSGHISSMSIMIFIETRKQVKGILTGMTVAMTVLILWQHVHYTIDILAAPPITYIMYRGMLSLVRSQNASAKFR